MQCGQLATAQDSQKTLEYVTTLQEVMGKAFDDATVHRRELAGTAHAELKSLSDSVTADSRAWDAKVETQLSSLWSRFEATLLTLQVFSMLFLIIHCRCCIPSSRPADRGSRCE